MASGARGPALEIRLLGRFAVRKDGVEIPAADFGGRKVRQLVRILASRRDTFVSNDALTEWIWPERAPADPAANLQVLVNRARRALGDPSAIRTGGGGYALADVVAVDVHEFVRAVRTAQGQDGAAALHTLRTALGAWHGEPLAEDAFESWARELRDEVQRVRLGALERAAQLALEMQRPELAVELADAAVLADPLRDTAVVALLRALRATGDTATALRRYDRYRRALAAELGVDPPAEAVAAYAQLLAGAPPADTQLQRRASAEPFGELPFVGRGAEVDALAAAVGPGGTGTGVVVGASGSGKSRLVATLAQRVPTVVVRAFLPERAEPNSLLRSLLRELVAVDITLLDRLPPALRDTLFSVVPELDAAPAAASDAQTRRALLSEATVRLVTELADMVIALDDVQWADTSSLAVIETVRLRVPRLRLVVAYRPEEVAAHGDVATFVAHLDQAVRVELAGLTRAELSAVIADESLAAALADTTDLTPVVVTEVLRALTMQDAVERGADGRWRCIDDSGVAVARELGRQGQRRVIALRVQRQAAEQRRLLEVLSLLGRETTPGLLADATGTSPATVHDRLADLYAAGLVRPGEAGWTTSHDLVTEVVVDEMNAAERSRLHACVAGALDAEGADPGGAAAHWLACGEHTRAASAFAAAARRALGSAASTEVIQLAGAGLHAAPAESAVAADLHEMRAEARALTGDIAGARGDLRAALATCSSGPARARLLGRLAMLASGSDDLVHASELAELALAEAGEDAAAQARALEIASVLDMNLERREQARDRASAAFAMYKELADADGMARVLDARAMASFLDGDVRAASQSLRRAADLFEDSGDLLRVLTPRATAGHALVFAGDPAGGLALISASLELARTLGAAEGQSYALWHCAEALAALGRPDDASRHAGEALAIATRIGHRGWTATAHRAVGVAAQAAGELDTALRAFEQSLALAEHLGLFACWAAARAALVHCALGEPARAEPLVAMALSLGPPLGHYEARLAQVELAALRGDERVAALARAALREADAGGVAQYRERLVQLAG